MFTRDIRSLCPIFQDIEAQKKKKRRLYKIDEIAQRKSIKFKSQTEKKTGDPCESKIYVYVYVYRIKRKNRTE